MIHPIIMQIGHGQKFNFNSTQINHFNIFKRGKKNFDGFANMCTYKIWCSSSQAVSDELIHLQYTQSSSLYLRNASHECFTLDAIDLHNANAPGSLFHYKYLPWLPAGCQHRLFLHKTVHGETVPKIESKAAP